MASIIREPNGRRTIQFSAADSTRKSIRLGKVSQSVADKVKVKIEHLIAATVSGFPMDNETAQWLAVIGDNLAAKLAGVGLIRERGTAQLGKFIESYIRQRTDVKSSTRRNLLAARSKLVEFYGEDKCLRDITPGDADAWKTWLKSRYAAGTTGRAIKFGKQFFRVAKRRRLVAENPFDEVKAPAQVNESRKAFISREDSQKVVDACPDHEWKLIFALSRYGGLRCPSETLALRWVDVDWERDRFWVPSPKTEGHEGHEGRWVPMFPELRPFLAAAFELAGVGAVHVVSRYRDPAKNFRTRMLRIIKRAGLKPWPKLFHNLRASRETELAGAYPIHVVCSWIGNSALIAAKHYLQVTEDHFESAAKSGAGVLQNAVQQTAAPSGTDSQDLTEDEDACRVLQDDASRSNSLPIGQYAWRDSNPQPTAP